MGESKAFRALDKLSSGIHYIQAAIASISGLLLLLGLVTASTNLLTKDWLFGTWPWLQYAWAFDQAIAVDANLALIGLLFFNALDNKDWGKLVVYTVIGGMLLFVAAVIMDIESVRQALDISLAAASVKVHVSLELLTQLRSWVVVLLVIVGGRSTTMLFQQKQAEPIPDPEPVVSQPDPVSTSTVQVPEPKPTKSNGHTPAEDKYQRYLEYVTVNPGASIPELAKQIGVVPSTISNYRRKQRKEHDELKLEVPTPAAEALS